MTVFNIAKHSEYHSVFETDECYEVYAVYESSHRTIALFVTHEEADYYCQLLEATEQGLINI